MPRSVVVAALILVVLAAWWLAEAVTKRDRASKDVKDAEAKVKTLKRELTDHRWTVVAAYIVAGLLVVITLAIIHGGPQ